MRAMWPPCSVAALSCKSDQSRQHGMRKWLMDSKERTCVHVSEVTSCPVPGSMYKNHQGKGLPVHEQEDSMFSSPGHQVIMHLVHDGAEARSRLKGKLAAVLVTVILRSKVFILSIGELLCKRPRSHANTASLSSSPRLHFARVRPGQIPAIAQARQAQGH